MDALPIGFPARMESIARGVEEAHAGKVVRHEPGHWTQLLEELDDVKD